MESPNNKSHSSITIIFGSISIGLYLSFIYKIDSNKTGVVNKISVFFHSIPYTTFSNAIALNLFYVFSSFFKSSLLLLLKIIL